MGGVASRSRSLRLPAPKSATIRVTSYGQESRLNATPAAFGTLYPEVARDLRLLRDFIEVRERHMRRLIVPAIREYWMPQRAHS